MRRRNVPDRIDPNVLMERAMAESAARLRAAQGIIDRPPPEPDPATHIDTRPIHAGIKVVPLWPPPDPYPPEHREMLCLVRAEDAPGLAERLGLTDAELWRNP